MTAKERNLVYGALVILNAILATCSQEHLLPASWAHVAAIASLVVSGTMREFNAKDMQSQGAP